IPFEELEDAYSPHEHEIFIAVGYNTTNQIRQARYYEARSKGYRCATYISPRASYYGTPVGDNCFILEDNTIQPFVKIGNNVILWSGNHIGHDSIIDDHCFLASHIVVSGHVYIHSYCFIGVNATLRNSITIARETLIGAGA